ncbi:MAG TPA: hypothetical protein VFR07_15085 [Mycobacteriales bacterium]|jgi:hypothetical protein|nr:hypothetical protein [Mycobacteriales bacterium]
MALLQLSEAERERRRGRAERLSAAKASRVPVSIPLDPDVPPVLTTWRARDLPRPRSGMVGVPLVEGVSSVFLGAILYVPVALVTSYAPWNYVVAALAVVVLSYALWSRRVVVGPGFVAVRKFGPYRVAPAQSIVAGGLVPSARGGVLVLRTGDGRSMRLRRVEYTSPAVNAELRRMLLASDRPYDAGVMTLLSLPWREDFGHSRYLLDAVQ